MLRPLKIGDKLAKRTLYLDWSQVTYNDIYMWALKQGLDDDLKLSVKFIETSDPLMSFYIKTTVSNNSIYFGGYTVYCYDPATETTIELLRIDVDKSIETRPVDLPEVTLSENWGRLTNIPDETCPLLKCITSSYPEEDIVIDEDIDSKEKYATFREDIYKWMKETLSPNLTAGDLDIIIKLMCYIFGDLTGITYKMKDQIDPDKADEAYLRHLCTVIGYEWNEALTADQQRESIKVFIDLRRRRGTIWSLENLIRVFGQDATTYYSSSDLRGVRVIEYNPETGKPDENGLYPGDLMIEVPQFSSIMRFAIDNIRLIGTRIIFCYMIYVGIFKCHTKIEAGREINQFFDPAFWGYDPKIKDWGPQEFIEIPASVKDEEGNWTESKELVPVDGTLTQFKDFFISHRVRSAISNASFATYIYKKKPYDRGFIWKEAGDDNYKGFLLDAETLKDNTNMYE